MIDVADQLYQKRKEKDLEHYYERLKQIEH